VNDTSKKRSHEVTELLSEWSGGDEEARDRLLAIVYDDLRSRARQLMTGERRNHTFDATALVHEAYVRLVNQSRASWQNRAHFFAAAAAMMRRILVDHARARTRLKRGGGWRGVSLDLSEINVAPASPDVIDVDAAIESLAAVDALQARIVELRFFGGLSIEETGHVLDISPSTAKREWQMARAWLWRRLHSQ
jgi:RNA polymerase sigma factor (TIGR02999 family)